MSIIWTDGAKYVLAVSCLSNDLRTWVLYSTSKTVDSQTQKIIVEKISEHKFDPNKVFKVSYDECKSI
jgi:hypothetical protein